MRWNRRIQAISAAASLIACAGTLDAAVPAPAKPRPEATEVRFTVGESALLDCLRAATPQTVTVGSKMISTDLTFLDPSDVQLKDGKASFRIRVKGRTIPVDQVVRPTVSLERDPVSGQYFGVIASLPIQIPGLGGLDLKDYLPRFEIPAVLENTYQVSERPLGMRLRIKRITILEDLLEVGADVDFAPVVSSRMPG